MLKKTIALILATYIIFASVIIIQLQIEKEQLIHDNVFSFMEYFATNYNLPMASEFEAIGIFKNDISYDVLEKMNSARGMFNFEYFYIVERNKGNFRYGIGAFDESREWLEGSGLYEYNAIGEVADDGEDYNLFFRMTEHKTKRKLVIHNTEYGYLTSYYLRIDDDYMLCVDFRLDEIPLSEIKKRNIRIITFVLGLGALSIFIILKKFKKAVE